MQPVMAASSTGCSTAAACCCFVAVCTNGFEHSSVWCDESLARRSILCCARTMPQFMLAWWGSSRVRLCKNDLTSSSVFSTGLEKFGPKEFSVETKVPELELQWKYIENIRKRIMLRISLKKCSGFYTFDWHFSCNSRNLFQIFEPNMASRSRALNTQMFAVKCTPHTFSTSE